MKTANIVHNEMEKRLDQKASWYGGSCAGRITVGGTLSRSGDIGRGCSLCVSSSVSMGRYELITLAFVLVLNVLIGAGGSSGSIDGDRFASDSGGSSSIVLLRLTSTSRPLPCPLMSDALLSARDEGGYGPPSRPRGKLSSLSWF